MRAVVPIFRQLYSHREPTSFVKLLGLLAAHVAARTSHDQAEALAALRELRHVEREIMRSHGIALILNGETLTPRQLVDLFLHGHYLHKGNAKSQKLAEWPLTDVARHAFFTTLVRLRNLYWVGANVVRRILAEPDLLAD